MKLAILLSAIALAGTTPGPKYNVYKNGAILKSEKSIWFNTRADWTREVWQACRAKGMTKRGALLAVAHARLAGGHWLTPKKTKGPLRGWNLWGIRATPKWKKAGKGYYYANGLDWRYYATPSHGVGGWLFVMEDYPEARAELFAKHPSFLAYAAGLCDGKGGKRYKTCYGPDYPKKLAGQLQSIADKAADDLRAQGFNP
jgi:hypothetical protein